MKRRTVADFERLMQAMAALIDQVNAEESNHFAVMASMVIDGVRGRELSPTASQDAIKAARGRIEAAAQVFEEAAVHLLGERRLPGEAYHVYVGRIDQIFAEVVDAETRARSIAPAPKESP